MLLLCALSDPLSAQTATEKVNRCDIKTIKLSMLEAIYRDVGGTDGGGGGGGGGGMAGGGMSISG